MKARPVGAARLNATTVEVKRGLAAELAARRVAPPAVEAGTAFSPGAAVDPRPRAPWSPRAQALANRALEAAKGLRGDAAVKKAVEVLAADASVAGARLSLCVGDLRGGAPIVSAGAQDDVNPASNSKLATATFAMAVLGADHRFETPFTLDPEGRLSVIGSFDPSLTTARLEEAARALKAAGVTEVSGITLDNGRLEGTRRPDHFAEAGDADWEFLASPEALSVDKNLVYLNVTPADAAGRKARIEVDQGAFEIRNSTRTSAPNREFHLGVDELDQRGELIRDRDGQAIIEVVGDIAQSYTRGKPLKMKSPDPVAGFSDKLVSALRSAGISVDGPVSQGRASPEGRTVFTSTSAPLAELMRTSIAESNAFDHEMYALAAGLKQRGGESITIDGATAELGRFLHQELGLETFRFDNASGIGNANRLSSSDVLAILRADAANPRFRPILDGLARPGLERSTLATRMLGTPAEQSLRAKTGTLSRIVALSGVVGLESDAPLAFSVLLNALQPGTEGRETGRAFVDAFGTVLATLQQQV
ncbi:MAG: D-alanyl-D-alanine carboxypeptidase/D-alanyl-D-alanine-endopeptidase [Archangiaceae bacterium]|nr:D-alanyl-D-alanine carboxypeptidase/D-alanyl-D-alanine-endopeptidase [Archangiaceae bacterium]